MMQSQFLRIDAALDLGFATGHHQKTAWHLVKQVRGFSPH